jgi:hypothetical protein
MRCYCLYRRCTFEGTKPYVFNLPHEALMDEHNIATVFCPHCQSKLMVKASDELTAKGS